MFKNILRKKRTSVGDLVDSNNASTLFNNDPIAVVDTLYVIYFRNHKVGSFQSVIDDFVNGVYGKFTPDIRLKVLIRGMIVFRENKNVKDMYFVNAISIINKENGVIPNISTKLKNIINVELGNHYLEYYNDKESAISSFRNIRDLSPVTIQTLFANVHKVNDPPLQCFTINDVIEIELSTMYDVLRAGFIVHALEKGTSTWFRWNKKERFKELFVIVVEMYSLLNLPLCGNDNITKAINECILIYTSDPPVLEILNTSLSRIEQKYNVEFDRETLKFKWY